MFLSILNKKFAYSTILNHQTLKYANILLLKRQASSSSSNLNSSLFNKIEQHFATKHPKVYAYYVMSVSGSKSCLSDTKIYFKLRKQILLKERNFSDFSIPELLIYLQFPAELVHICLLVFLLQIPIVGEIIIALGIFRPQLVLTRHFWTPQQTTTVQLNELKKIQDVNFPCILQQLSEKNKNLSTQLPLKFYQLLSTTVNLPKLEELSSSQLYHLKRLHKVSPFSLGTKSLMERVLILQLLDSKMSEDTEKELKGLNVTQLQLHLYIRKLNYAKMDAENMQSLLNKWLQHCSTLPPSTYVYAPFLIQTKF
uniref:Uncharacterized protein n=1 Tax=Meloidogyne enterolobii TaxID=390850 RepID=A0A6V7TQR8_MELEN|nr:unnamed protein product [Meloidogyne enterolobii]